MQVSNTLNNVIRILFNPKVEEFKLFDFLMVKSNSDRYIAQITEIYNDKFDASQDVARLKLFYKIGKNNEVMPYDNFTPNKECEIIKIKQEDIESFLNVNKETFVFGTNSKTLEPLNIQYNFFNQNAIIIADKVDYASLLSISLAKKLSTKKHAVIIDSTGILEFDEAKKIKASKDFKLPLNYSTIDFIFDKCLADATLEFQASCRAIINEIKKFARKQEHEFIPFNTFTRVLMEQYKATPFPELKLLIARLKNYQMDEIFARNKKDYENLFKTISKNEITMVDLSSVDSFWQKVFLEHITDGIKDEVYLITRINDENCDVDLINKIYCNKQNIKFIPNVSYNYKKLPSIVQYCKNYILMQSLYQRSDFLNANFALANLVAHDCILFGENTDNFLYLARDYELKIPEKKEQYRKIALSLLDDDKEEDITSEEDIKQKQDTQKLLDELSKFDEERNALKQVSVDDLEEPKTKEEDYFENITAAEKNNVLSEISTEKPLSNDDFQELSNSKIQTTVENTTNENTLSEDIIIPTTNNNNENAYETNEIDLSSIAEQAAMEINQEENIEKEDRTKEEIIPAEANDDSLDENSAILELLGEDEPMEITEDNEIIQETEQEVEQPEITVDDNKTEESNNEQENYISDDELDFFEISRQPSNSNEAEVTTETAPNDTSEEEIDLNEVVNESINDNFNNIINSDSTKETQGIALDKDIVLDSKLINSEEKKEDLPIFKEEIPEEDNEVSFKKGDRIVHNTYGSGIIIKTLQHDQRQIIQVKFETAGIKLLDPRIANIKLEQ